MFINGRVFFVIILFVITINLGAQFKNENTVQLYKGKIIPEVICMNDREQSYALYLPGSYSANKKWPVLYLFEPGARAMIPMELFKDAAEKYEYILICSNNSKNGPAEPINRAIKAIWNDTNKRLSINVNRVYAGGFSGGARVGSQFQFIVKNHCAGIISFGAGLSPVIKPEYILHSDYFGAVGMADFNYREMTALDTILEKAGVIHNIIVFDGTHNWPKKNICTMAIEWMEIRAMKRGFIKNNMKIVEILFQKQLDNSRKLNMENKVFQAYRSYEATEKLFTGLIDVTSIIEEKDKLKKSYKKVINNDKKNHKIELSILKDFYGVLYLLKKNNNKNILFREQMNKIPLKKLRKWADSKVDFYKRNMAKRLISSIMDRAVREGYRYMRKKDYKKSIILFEISIRSGNENPVLFYNLACSFAQSGYKKKAIKAIDLAIKNGFKDNYLLRTDKDLESIRKEKKFNDLLKNLKL